jgi:hypothetical protein
MTGLSSYMYTVNVQWPCFAGSVGQPSTNQSVCGTEYESHGLQDAGIVGIL